MSDRRFPLYIVSKGRYEHRERMTARALIAMGVPFRMVVEEQEHDHYAAAIPEAQILVLPKRYQDEYDTFDTLGDSRSKGPGPARNFAWDDARENGHYWHWVMDDNINGFYRFQRNFKVRCQSPAWFQAQEDFVLRYSNVLMAGPNYFMFVCRKEGHRIKPFTTNTRIYSCNLIRTGADYRWRGRYNEDTDLSLRMLKDGWCTILFNAFLQYKMPTQMYKGGNTTEFYDKEGTKVDGERYARDGTLAKSKMQVHMHPDVSKLVWRFGRVHHHVNYAPFRKNKLRRRADSNLDTGTDDYGMEMHRVRVPPKMVTRVRA